MVDARRAGSNRNIFSLFIRYLTLYKQKIYDDDDLELTTIFIVGKLLPGFRSCYNMIVKSSVLLV